MKQLIGNSPLIDMRIGETVIPCLLGTGSMVKTISESFFKKHLETKFTIQSNHNWLRLKATNGLEIPYTGYIESGVYIPLIDKIIESRGILIVKDCSGAMMGVTQLA
jgi:hypothetical protein